MKNYKVIYDFSSFNSSTGETKDFAVGEVIQAYEPTTTSWGTPALNILITSDGFSIEPDYVTEVTATNTAESTTTTPNSSTKKMVWIAVIGIVVIISGIIIYKRLKK